MRILVFFLLPAIVSLKSYSQNHGLQFSSHEAVQEKRTALNLTPDNPVCFSKPTEVSFDVIFRPNLETYFGYVMRVVTTNNLNIDLVYNEKLRVLNFVVGERFSTSINIDSLRLLENWGRCSLMLNPEDNSVSLGFNGRELATTTLDTDANMCVRLFWGTNDLPMFQTMDIPPMQVKEIIIKEGERLLHHYPLDELEGNTATDRVTGNKAVVKNPVWIKHLHQVWRKVYSLRTAGVPAVAFNNKREALFFTGKDSLYEFAVADNSARAIRLAKGRSKTPGGNQAIYNPYTNLLCNFDIDEQLVSVYDSAARVWDKDFVREELTIFWQANKCISPYDSCLYIIGGYGQLQYKNLVQRYHFDTGRWDTLQPSGDFFMPRYLSALGLNAGGDTIYIAGGYGSNTGDQTINPRHIYDVMAYSIRHNSFELLTQLETPGNPFCFANSLVAEPGTNQFYALTYPNTRFNSSLQLVKGSFKSPEYSYIGDTIPFFFYDIESFSDLFFSPVSKKLLAVTMHSGKEGYTDIDVYSLDFPPNSLPVKKDARSSGRFFFYILMGVLLAGSLIFALRRRRNRSATGYPAVLHEEPVNDQAGILLLNEQDMRTLPSSVITFGAFEVYDKQGNNITMQFTPLLKELFLLILVHSVKDGGITHEQLYSVLWEDKSFKDAKNNYHVNSGKLKSILEKVGKYQIGRDGNKLKFEVLNQTMFVDFARFFELVSMDKHSRQDINELYVLTHRGGFLAQLRYEWLDDIKSWVSGKMIDILLKHMSDFEKEADWIVRLANTVFVFDELNESALVYKCRALVMLGRHGLAKDSFSKFTRAYRETYGQNYEKSFTQITGQV